LSSWNLNLINYNIINKFYILYIQNEINDIIYRKNNILSKINNSYWIFDKKQEKLLNNPSVEKGKRLEDVDIWGNILNKF